MIYSTGNYKPFPPLHSNPFRSSLQNLPGSFPPSHQNSPWQIFRQTPHPSNKLPVSSPPPPAVPPLGPTITSWLLRTQFATSYPIRDILQSQEMFCSVSIVVSLKVNSPFPFLSRVWCPPFLFFSNSSAFIPPFTPPYWGLLVPFFFPPTLFCALSLSVLHWLFSNPLSNMEIPFFPIAPFSEYPFFELAPDHNMPTFLLNFFFGGSPVPPSPPQPLP